MRLEFRTRALALKAPLRSAWGEIVQREIVEVEIHSGDGRVGRGEAAPLEPYDGVPLAAVLAALDAYTAILRVLPERIGHADVVDACAAERLLPQALAAIDIALWDLDGQRGGFPAAQLIAAGAPARVPVNALVASPDEAAAAARAGFGCVKVKVGLGDDVARVSAIRDAIGPEVALRVDANGAWSDPDDAIGALEELAPYALELCEEPVHGVEGLRAVRDASPVPIAMDETDEPGSGATDYVCLKVSRSGGIAGVLRDAALARDAGSGVYVASTFDGPIGIAAGLHVAAGLATRGRMPACGLATLSAFSGVEDPFAFRDGTLELPAGEGLGLP